MRMKPFLGIFFASSCVSQHHFFPRTAYFSVSVKSPEMIPQNQYVERLIGFKEHPDDIPSLVRASFIAVFTLIQINPFKTGNGSETFSVNHTTSCAAYDLLIE